MKTLWWYAALALVSTFVMLTPQSVVESICAVSQHQRIKDSDTKTRDCAHRSIVKLIEDNRYIPFKEWRPTDKHTYAAHCTTLRELGEDWPDEPPAE